MKYLLEIPRTTFPRIINFLIVFSLLSNCAPIVIEEDMQKHISSMNKTALEIEEILKKAKMDLEWGDSESQVQNKYEAIARERFKEINKKLDDYVKYCDQQRLPDEIMDKYLEQVDLSKVKDLIAQLKEKGVEFNFE